MNRFEDLIKSTSAQPSVIVHLGAGTCSEYESYKALGPDHVIYVEPEQYLAEAAIDTFANTSNVTVIQHAIAAENGPQTLNITNNRRFSSLLLPDELFNFYPNIEVDDNAEVEAVTLTKLCQGGKVSKDLDNLLIAELNGMEKEVFPSVELDTLQYFKWIIIRSSETNLYTPVSSNAQRSLSEVMQDAGFMVLAFEEDAPPFLNILCIRNDAAIDNNQLKAQEVDLLETIRILEHNLSKQIAELTAAKAQVQSITAEKDNQQQHIKELSSTIEAKSTELEKAQALMQSVTAEKDNQQQHIKELSSTIEARSAELETAQALVQSITDEQDNQQQQIKELSSTIEARSAELDTTQALVQSITDEKDNQQQQIKELSSTIEARSAELDTTQALIQSVTAEKDNQLHTIKELSSAIEARSAELESAQALMQSVTAEKDNQLQHIKELSSTIEASSAELESAQALIQSVTAEKDNQLHTIKELFSAIEARSAELETAQALVQSITDEKDNQQQQISALTDSLKEKEKELSGMQQTLRINNKLILKSDTDLRDLQLQYRAALQHQEQQYTLLCELKEKLRQASEFYQKLNLQNLVLDADLLEQSNSDNVESDSDDEG